MTVALLLFMFPNRVINKNKSYSIILSVSVIRMVVVRNQQQINTRAIAAVNAVVLRVDFSACGPCPLRIILQCPRCPMLPAGSWNLNQLQLGKSRLIFSLFSALDSSVKSPDQIGLPTSAVA